VRNAYESAIGHFQPPPGGAELIDPKMRNSHEFPKWLNMPETKKRLEGKKVMILLLALKTPEAMIVFPGALYYYYYYYYCYYYY